jgi:hypothetical protein
LVAETEICGSWRESWGGGKAEDVEAVAGGDYYLIFRKRTRLGKYLKEMKIMSWWALTSSSGLYARGMFVTWLVRRADIRY